MTRTRRSGSEVKPGKETSGKEKIMKTLIRSSKIVALSIFLVLVGICGISLHGMDDPGKSDSRIQRGFDIAPVPLNLEGKNRALVGLGSYIVNGPGMCGDCHSQPSFKPGGNPFLGQPEQTNTEHYLAGGRRFLGGTIISRNITPDPETGLPAGLTFEQFAEVIRKGTDFDNLHPQISPLLQVMTWPWFAKMTDRDLRAMYEYLSAIPHAE